MGSAGTEFDVGDTITEGRMNQKCLFVGTGTQITALATTYPGQLAYSTDTSGAFTADTLYQRNAADSAWVAISVSITSDITLQGDYNASTNSPDLDTAPSGILKGDHYVVSVAGTAFFTETLESGDSLIAKQDNPTLVTHWIISQTNLTAASIKTLYESNSDTNALTDTEKTAVGNLSGTNSGDESAASTSAAGISELATTAELDAGTDTTRAVTVAAIEGSARSAKVDGIAASANNYSHPNHSGDVTSTGDGATVIASDAVTLSKIAAAAKTESISLALGDESTVLAAASSSVPVVAFHMPYGFVLTDVKVGCTVAPTGAALLTVDVHEAGTTVLSTKVTVDASEKTSGTAATAPVVSDSALAVDSLIEIFVDQIDTDNVAAGVKVYLIGYQS